MERTTKQLTYKIYNLCTGDYLKKQGIFMPIFHLDVFTSRLYILKNNYKEIND